MNTVKHLYILLILIFLPQLYTLQGKERSFDLEKLERLAGEEGFDQTKKEGKIPYYGSEPLPESQIDDTFGDSSGRQREQNINKTDEKFVLQLMYVFAGVLLTAIVVVVLKNTVAGSGQKLQTDGLPEIANGDIQALDTQSLIAQAVADKNFRLAIRLNYLDVLKKMDRRKWIKWTQNKTNQDYVREFSSHRFGKDFQLLTYHFDYTWYGDFQVEEKLYYKLSDKFQQFHHQIDAKS